MNTIYGPCIGDGFAMRTRHFPNKHGAMQTERDWWATPINELRQRQAERIPVDIGHDGNAVGQVIHLEVVSGPPERLWAVCEVNEAITLPADREIFFSVATTADWGGRDVRIDGLGLCARSAQLGLLPLRQRSGDLHFRGAEKRWRDLSSFEAGLLERAAEARFHRRDRGHGIEVYDAKREHDLLDRRLVGYEKFMVDDAQREDLAELVERIGPSGPLRYRPSHVISVR